MCEVVDLSPHFIHNPIHGGRDAVVIMSGDKFGHSPCVELAARSPQSTRKTLSVLKDVIWDGNSCFHTKSITAGAGKSRRKTARSTSATTVR